MLNKILVSGIMFFLQASSLLGQKTIHVYVALCDNENQGIVPVPSTLGNGQDARNNLYWGALYGVKTHFKKSAEWISVPITSSKKNVKILDRILFKHRTKDIYLLAEAYDGIEIQKCIQEAVNAVHGHGNTTIHANEKELNFGGSSDLIAYVGHDGLMEFDIDQPARKNNAKKDFIFLACISQSFFKPYVQNSGARPLVWSTGLMSPEAYTLKAALNGWVQGESQSQIRERAAGAYHKYQKCGMNGARNLLVTGW
ncbi:MAG: hypothetical protein MRY83_07365 [Flavobacteriales bacterium]|nr:hypothetical protein [Flavobacteriales bacterium]